MAIDVRAAAAELIAELRDQNWILLGYATGDWYRAGQNGVVHGRRAVKNDVVLTAIQSGGLVECQSPTPLCRAFKPRP